MPPKRPQPNVFGDDDNGGSGSRSDPAQAKKAKLNPSQIVGGSSQGSQQNAKPNTPLDVNAQIAAAKAKIAASMASLNAKKTTNTTAPPSSLPSRPSPSSSSASNNTLPASAPKVGSTALPPSGGAGKFDIAAVRRQVEEAQRKQAQRQAQGGNQVQPGQQKQQQSSSTNHGRDSGTSDQRGTGIHPLLMQTSSGSGPSIASNRHSRASPSIATGASRKGGPSPSVETVNPYLSHADEGDEQDPSAVAGPSRGNRSMHKALQFNRPGRHIQAAGEARKQAELEALKKRIADSAKRAGMQQDLTGEERRIKKQAPPDVEWWDAPLLPGGNYDAVPEDPKGSSGSSQAGMLLITGEGSPIDVYVQHPIPIPAPSDKYRVEPKGVILTKKEMKKMRRQRRAAEQEDKRDRIKMGLEPPDPPKVKLSNLMRVLTSEAVADPTKVEARVRREIAARQEQHERTNAERALTDDQKREKKLTKMEKEEAKGIFVTVYKIKHLVSGAHKFKVRKNAEQNGLTGLCIFHTEFALVIVEGSAKGIKNYKKLMTHRIDWTDPGRARDSNQDENNDQDIFSLERGGQSRRLVPMGEVQQPSQHEKDSTNAALVDWSANTCHLIFEGPERERVFPQGYRARNADSDYDAREILGTKWAGFWDIAKRFEAAQED
ncbi:unnamed protein product [Sympodiomycopsis kandeliae]